MPETEPSFGAPKGTRDLLPPASWAWQRVIRLGQDMFASAGYAPIETPLFEHTEVFERGVGATSEVVGKQMYTFLDRGGRSLTLRPEATASVVRAVVENGLERGALPVKFAYAGPMFRQERPQKGRYRQFFQIGIEALGSPGPVVDAEVIELGSRFLRVAGVPSALKLNSIGHPAPECRHGYNQALVSFLEAHRDELAEEDRPKVDTNPMRLFDSKEGPTQRVMSAAPVIADHLCPACKEHYAELRSLLDSLGVDYTEDPRLVRGLDYYTRTAFEYIGAAEGALGSQDAVGGGGRYDGLAEVLGGSRVPGIGFALGLDRIMLSLAGSDREGAVQVYVVALGGEAQRAALPLTTRLRQAGISSDLDLMGRGMKGQMKDADRSGARFAVILGEDELAAGEVTVKDLISGDQGRVPTEDLESDLLGRLRTEGGAPG